MIRKFMLSFAITLITAQPVLAVDTTTETEKRYLIKIANELAYLQALTEKAKKVADLNARITLDYVALEHDLREIRRALEMHVNAPSRSPRKSEQLQLTLGDYE